MENSKPVPQTHQDTAVLTAFERFSEYCDADKARESLHLMFAVFASHNDATAERIQETTYHYQHLTELLFILESIGNAAAVE
jgi:hypothetical protein